MKTGLMKWKVALAAVTMTAGLLAANPGAAQRGRGPGDPTLNQTPQEMAPIDLAGTWVSVITEDWRFRMMTPREGELDIEGVPLNAVGRQLAIAWDPAVDEAAGLQCKGYGAAALMRLPGRARISWVDEETLRIDYDTGEQSRILHFVDEVPSGLEPSLQGYSQAEWERQPNLPSGRGGGRGAPPGPLTGSLEVTTSNLLPGYLRKNGVPYGENAVMTEYFDLRTDLNGDVWFTVTSIVEDPDYLSSTYIVSSDFKKEADDSKWNPTPCSAY